MNTRQQGYQQEQTACRFLESQGLKLSDQNYQTRIGELDLIMEEENTLVFIEVRYRKNDHFGSPIASVDAQKQKRIILAAEIYLQAHRWAREKPIRFDVVGISPKKKDELQFDWIKNAFSA